MWSCATSNIVYAPIPYLRVAQFTFNKRRSVFKQPGWSLMVTVLVRVTKIEPSYYFVESHQKET